MRIPSVSSVRCLVPAAQSRMALLVAVVLVVAVALAGCSAPGEEAGPSEAGTGEGRAVTVAPSSPAASGSDGSDVPDGTSSAAPSASPSSSSSLSSSSRRQRGVDVSHHQGDIDWARVAGDGIEFAYLKATEGSTFTDPAFAANVAGARAAGLRVGGYHYFTLCSPPGPQADHFVATWRSVGLGPRALPPVVDLELIGNCDPPPVASAMLAAARDFVSRVEDATRRRVVVYVHPDFEATYPGLVDALDRRRWVRRTGSRPPPGDWWMWQRSDHAQVAGISTPVDLDVLRPDRHG